MHAVAGGGGRPTCNGTGFADPLFQNLTINRLSVTEYRANVFWLVSLPNTGLNTDLLK